jgi:uncharacterized membrane protein
MATRVEPARTAGAPRLLAVLRAAPALAAMAVMAIAGAAIGGYLTVEHYAHQEPFCTAVGPINCASVLNSPYSVLPGTAIPITIPGLLWFLVSGGLAVVGLAAIWRARPEPERLRLAHLTWAGAGLLFVLYLVWAEIVQVHAICAWCTVVHLLTLATFLLALNRWQQTFAPEAGAGPSRQMTDEPLAAPRAPRQMALPPRARRATPAGTRRAGSRTARHR